MSIVLKTSAAWKAGHINILPILGKVCFSALATIEVESEDIAKEVISLLPEFSVVEAEVKKIIEPEKVAPVAPAPIAPQTQQEDLSKKQTEGDIAPQTVESAPLGAASTPAPISTPVSVAEAPAPIAPLVSTITAPVAAVVETPIQELEKEITAEKASIAIAPATDGAIIETADELAEDAKSPNSTLLGTLRAASKDELIAFAQPFPKEDWESLNKADLFSYLRKQLVG